MSVFNDRSRWQVIIEPSPAVANSITQHFESDLLPWEEAQLMWLRECTKAGYSPGAFSGPIVHAEIQTAETIVTLTCIKF